MPLISPYCCATTSLHLEQDESLHRSAADIYARLLDSEARIPDVLLQVGEPPGLPLVAMNVHCGLCMGHGSCIPDMLLQVRLLSWLPRVVELLGLWHPCCSKPPEVKFFGITGLLALALLYHQHSEHRCLRRWWCGCWASMAAWPPPTAPQACACSRRSR